MAKDKSKSLSWDDFQSLGNPENVEPTAEFDASPENDKTAAYSNHIVRIHLDKKGRNGKQATLIKGIEMDDVFLKDLSKEMKSLCGVGGTAKNGEIILQGNHRVRIMDLLIKKGFSNTKLAGG